jgi:hypothetical protein
MKTPKFLSKLYRFTSRITANVRRVPRVSMRRYRYTPVRHAAGRHANCGASMKLALLAIMALATTAFGELGDTPEQFETGKPTNVIKYKQGTTWITWAGRKITHEGLFDVVANGEKCVMETFRFHDRHRMTPTEITKFIAPYTKRGWLREPVTDWPGGGAAYAPYQDANGNQVGFIIYDSKNNILCVMTTDVWTQVYAKAAKQETPAVVTDQDQVAGLSNDCLLVATEAHARLKTTALWARIVGFKMMKDNKVIAGHAVVFYQPVEGSNVFMYDKTLGSVDLHTQSHELTELIWALNQALHNANYVTTVASPAWIGE